MNSVYIEITDACNFRCSFCPCGKTDQSDASPSMRYSSPGSNTAPSFNGTCRTFMPSALFEKCLDEAKSVGATNVFFHVLGEPTLHPGFGPYLKKVESTPLKATLTTNGSTIARTGHSILDCKSIRQINFSTHAYAELDRETAEKHLQNVLDFCQMALALRPELYINLRLWNVGAEEASPWNNYMLARVNETFGTDVAPGHFCSRHKSFNVTGRLYLHEDTRFEWPGLDERRETTNAKGECSGAACRPIVEPGIRQRNCKDERSDDSSSMRTTTTIRGSCHALDTHVAILHDGRVVACCLDHSGQITLGKIQEQSLAEILESPFATQIREGFAKHELRHPFCQKCSYCKRFK